jgi:serine/threonine protein phosphatase PrpC
VLRVVEQAHRSDTGRQRAANEDSFFARSPQFAVADGMGGAQAGEVASRIAAESFEPAERGSGSPESYLRGIAEGANARIHELAQSDASRSGMGTTLTAALLEGDELSLAHVGDSRAYRFRDGELRLLTSDHSLVEELRRQGRLTDEQAEDHPQRSIITRALGPEADVEVDTMTYRARPGDVYLLCSDGLTTMLKEPQLAEALAAGGSLEDLVEKLITEANEAGGRDNITIVAFRLDDDEAPVGAPPTEPPGGEGATLIGPSAEDAGLTGEAVRERVEAERVALGGAAAKRPSGAPEKRSRRRQALRVLVPALILAVVIAGAVYGIRQVYFLGSDSAGRVALYRGLPYELPLGINLYSEVYAAPVQVNSLPPARRQSAIDHTLRGHDDAVSLIDDLVKSAKPPQPKPQPKPRPQQPKANQRQKQGTGHPNRQSGGSGNQAGGGK